MASGLKKLVKAVASRMQKREKVSHVTYSANGTSPSSK
jgi:hypothetical protein